ncbi:cyclin-like protein [Artomyces pyxidatus]|uniref:Cyclin-like protein n=1 Tax=Artomyces pyxidatus TaxID=48021 RepID=A0ACB8SJ44_9AGAM|nr:cyclin-like protein [Artomyces pyxidatus]
MDLYSRDSPSISSSSYTKHHRPYFTPSEVERLSDRQRGKLSVSQEEKARQQACGFIEAVGSRIGFPRKTIATGQNLYHRFHLYFPRKDFGFHDVALAALYVSTKMHDTLKKPREIIMASYAVRFPEQAAKSKSIVGEIDMDPAVVEQDRQRVLAVERLILEAICFNFTSRMPFPYVIKIGRELKASKKLTKHAWRLTVDSQRTLVALQYPPHVVAMACIYLSALLSSFEQNEAPARPGCVTEHAIAEMLKQHGPWERKFQVQVEDLEAISHHLLDLLISSVENPSANTSPSTPASPSPHLSRTHVPSLPQMVLPYKSDQLMRLKIAMRETEHPPRSRTPLMGDSPREPDGPNTFLGRNEGTVRFLFGPNGGS